MVAPPKDLCFFYFQLLPLMSISSWHASTHDRLLMTAQTPPPIHVSQILSSWPHKPTILKRNAAQYFNKPRGGPHWNIEPHWVSIWQIQDPRFRRTLGVESWITDLGSAILKFNISSIFQYGPPWIQDSSHSQESSATLDLGSWIRHIEIQCVSIFQCGPVPFLVLLSPRLVLLSACAYLRHPKKQTN